MLTGGTRHKSVWEYLGISKEKEDFKHSTVMYPQHSIANSNANIKSQHFLFSYSFYITQKDAASCLLESIAVGAEKDSGWSCDDCFFM